MVQIPQTYPPVEPVLVSFDWIDIANGLGYQIYYGATANSSNESIIVESSTIQSQKPETSFGVNTDSFIKYYDEVFDITFNSPRRVKGNIYILVPLNMRVQSPSSDHMDAKAIVRVYHYDGSTETLIGSETSSEEFGGSLISSEPRISRMALIKINASSFVSFAKGETLRFDVEGWFKEESANPAFGSIGHDPSKESIRGVTSWESGANRQMSFHVPFDLNP